MLSDAEGVKHVEQSMPCDWATFSWGDSTFVAYNVPEGPEMELFVVSSVTNNVRNLARADAVLYEGHLTRPHYDESINSVEFCHEYAGSIGREHAGTWLREPAVRLSAVPHSNPMEVML